MKLKIAWIGRTKEPAIQSLTAEYLKRISRYAEVEGVELRDESGVLNLAAGKSHSKLRHTLVLLDPGGKVNKDFAIDGIPKTFVYDREGKLVAQAIDMRTRGQFLEMLSLAGLK